MKIICYINRLCDGGAERVMSVLANGLARREHQVTVVTEYCSPNDYALDANVRRVILEGAFSGPSTRGRIARTIKRIVKLRSLCKKEQANIVISFMEDANSRAIFATKFLKTKNLISIRIDPEVLLKNRTKRIQLTLIDPMANGCVFQTQKAKLALPIRLQRKSKVIFNPVSDVFFETTHAAMQENRIVACGRLEKQKRFDLLIDAFDKVCDEFPDYRLEIYGVGALQQQLQTQIDSLGRQDRIRLMGRSEDIPDMIKTASLFVLSSDFEGLPNALMEAMVLGLPVVSTDCGGGGARALVEDGVDGILVPVNDVDALADAIRNTLADPDAAKLRGKKASEKAKGFSAENVVAQWEAYIKQIVGNNT